MTRNRWGWSLGLLALVGVAGVLAVRLRPAARPANLGVRDGRLADCPDSPNCVSSRATDPGHRVEPIRFDGDPAAAWQRLRSVAAGWPRWRVITDAEGYLHVEARTLVFGFVDDLECQLDPEARVIHVRSASRVGHSDLGVNRVRVERLRAALGEPAGEAR